VEFRSKTDRHTVVLISISSFLYTVD